MQPPDPTDTAAPRGFRALKQLVKLHFKLGKHKEMLERYRQMLCAAGGEGSCVAAVAGA